MQLSKYNIYIKDEDKIQIFNTLTHSFVRIKQSDLEDARLHESQIMNPAKRNVLDLKNETCKNREKRNVLKISHTRHSKAIKKQSVLGCFYGF